MKQEFFDTIEPEEEDIKVNDTTYQADLDHAIQVVWDKLIKSGVKPSLTHLDAFKTNWEETRTRKDIDSLELRPYRAGLKSRRREKAKEQINCRAIPHRSRLSANLTTQNIDEILPFPPLSFGLSTLWPEHGVAHRLELGAYSFSSLMIYRCIH